MKQIRDAWVVTDQTLEEGHEIQGVYASLEIAVERTRHAHEEATAAVSQSDSGEWAIIHLDYGDFTHQLHAQRFAYIEEAYRK